MMVRGAKSLWSGGLVDRPDLGRLPGGQRLHRDRGARCSRGQNADENPATKLQIEYQAIEIISGNFRPTRSASQPLAVAPIRPRDRCLRRHSYRHRQASPFEMALVTEALRGG
jgi:hypothetical protein